MQRINDKLKSLCKFCSSHLDKPCAWISLGNEYCDRIMDIQSELNNRIPREKILEFAKRLEDIQDKEDEKLENFGFDLGGRQFIPVRNIVANELRKLLNKE